MWKMLPGTWTVALAELDLGVAVVPILMIKNKDLSSQDMRICVGHKFFQLQRQEIHSGCWLLVLTVRSTAEQP